MYIYTLKSHKLQVTTLDQRYEKSEHFHLVLSCCAFSSHLHDQHDHHGDHDHSMTFSAFFSLNRTDNGAVCFFISFKSP